MQPDQCQERQKVRNDVSLHRLCRYGGQNQKQTESGKQGVGERDGEKQANSRHTNTNREGREMGANTEKRSKCRHERGSMRDRERKVKQGGGGKGGGVQATAGKGIPRANCQCSGAP